MAAKIKVHKKSNYTVIDNYPLMDKNLSLKALGLLCKMLSLPMEWDYSISGLSKLCKDKEYAVQSTLHELEELGYITVEKLYPGQSETGRIDYIYNVYERPVNDKERTTKDDRKTNNLQKQDPENSGVVQDPENSGVAPNNIDNIYINNKYSSIETTSISKDIKVVSSPEQPVEGEELPKNFNPLDFSEENNEQVQVMETCRESVRVQARRNSGKSKLIETDDKQNNQQELKKSVTGKKQTNKEPKRVSSEYKRERYLTAALAVVAQELNLFDKEKLHEISDWFESMYDKGVTSTKGVRFRKCLVQLLEYFKKYKWSELKKILSTCSQCAYSNLDWGVQKSSKSTYNKTDRTHFSRRQDETDEEYSVRVKSDRVTQEQREKLLKSEERV